MPQFFYLAGKSRHVFCGLPPGSFLARNIFSNLNHPYYNGFSGKEVLMKFFSSTRYTPQQLQNIAIDLFCDVLGSILSAIGIYTFAKLANFAPGGISGVALILNHLWNLPIGTTSLVINIPLILLSYRIVGRKFMIKSIRTILINTFFLDFVFPLTPAYDGNPMLAALFSGVFFGCGLALIYMRGSSTGGTDFLTMSIKALHPHLSIGAVTMAIDLVIR